MINDTMIVGSIAISGLSGCGNTSVSGMLAKQLNIPFYNYTFRALANDKGMALDEVARQAEISDDFDRYIDSRIKEYTRKNTCVVGSRLALWFAENVMFRVYLHFSLEERARRIALREEIEYLESYNKTKVRDARDIARYKRLYNIDILDFQSRANMIITDASLSVVQICGKILQNLQKKHG